MVVLLDHGLYTTIDRQTRYDFASLWKALIEQDEKGLMSAAARLKGGRDYRLFSSMIAQRSFEDIMTVRSVEDRLGRPTQEEGLERIKVQAYERHKDIVRLLNEMNRTLLMIFKINDFLRTIDCKLGSPINTFEITVICF